MNYDKEFIKSIDDDIEQNGDIRITKKELKEIHQKHYGDNPPPCFNLEEFHET